MPPSVLSGLSPASSSGVKNTDPAGLLLSKAGYAERAAERGPHRPHVGVRCPRRWHPRRGLTALLPRAPPSAFPRGSSPLHSSLSARNPLPSFPGAGLEAFSCTLPHSPLSWALGGPSVLRAGFKAHRGRFQSALHTVLPGHCACPVPCAGSFDALSGNYLGFGLCS